VFAYQPPQDQQRTDDFLVSYLKVACTITGYQIDGKEIRIRERLNRSGWTDKDLTDRLGEAALAYYACHGAILEVVVAPHAEDKRFTLEEYPYFADFDPKKRELYEIVTETGEVMSRSLEDVNVRLGQTTLQSHEVMDKTTLAASLSASYAGVTLAGSAANESGTTDLSQQGSENIRTSDAAREARETFSHTTQLSQMYHQLDSYHLGTNRAAFFVLPRPHMVQSPTTFVNGPREIEGIQEFMLVVVRPKAMEEYCVEAYLETAHLTGKPEYDYGRTETPLHLKVDAPDTTRHSDSATSVRIPGYVVDTDRGVGVPLGGIPHGDMGGYTVGPVNITMNGDYTFVVGTDTVAVHGWAEGLHTNHPDETYPGTLEVSATVYLKKQVPTVIGHKPGLMITGRAVCSCKRSLDTKAAVEKVSVVFEKELATKEMHSTAEREPMSIRDANHLGAVLKHEMLQSLSSPDRYPRGTVDLLDSQLMSEMMSTHIEQSGRAVNMPLMDWAGIDQKLALRVTAYNPLITRSQMLEMPLAEQVETFGLSFADVVKLRRSLADLAEPEGPPPAPERLPIQTPMLMGLASYEARTALSAAGLVLSSSTLVDSPMPSNTVVGQEPEPGAAIGAGSQVSIQLATGLSVRLPDVIGLQFSEAACRLRETGLRAEPSVDGQPGSDAVVVALEPGAGTLVTPSTAVTIKLRQRSANRRA